jgi:FKBP-type peptidyl-prolyl cis-trans isomerase (trigger factor)
MRWLIEKEAIKVTEDEVDHELGHMREHYSDPKMQAELNDPKFRDDLRTHLLTGKAIKKLVEYAKS